MLSAICDESFLLKANFGHFKKIREFVSDDEKLFNMLDALIPQALFNHFLFNILKFYRHCKYNEGVQKVENRIQKVDSTTTPLVSLKYTIN